MIRMYAPNVYMLWERGTGAGALRPIQPTLEKAKAILDAEILKAEKPALVWTDEFGGASADPPGELGYEVVPVDVDVTDLLEGLSNELLRRRDISRDPKVAMAFESAASTVRRG
jgi:hypothetical protein